MSVKQTIQWLSAAIALAMALSTQTTWAQDTLELQVIDQPLAKIYYIKVPPSRDIIIFPWVSKGIKTVEGVAKTLSESPYIEPIFVINDGFFDLKTKETISYVIKNGVVEADPTLNPGLMDNTGIQPYLSGVINRSAFRVLECPYGLIFKVMPQQSPPPMRCQIRNSIQAGPNLFSETGLIDEAFLAIDNTGKVLRDPVGYRWRNARSAVGVTDKGEALFVMVAMKAKSIAGQDGTKAESTGMNLGELGNIMRQLGAVEAMAMDGGTSSSIWFNGQNFFGKLSPQGQPLKRPVKSVWVVAKRRVP